MRWKQLITQTLNLNLPSMALRPPVSNTDHIEGNVDAPIELVEYGDYQCPHCGRAYPIIKALQKEFGDRLKFVFRNFPLRKIHPEAEMAAIAAEAAALQGKYFEMHDIIFENQDALSEEVFPEFARAIDLDQKKFITDLSREDLKTRVESDFESGIRSGVNATPTFFINGEKYTRGWEGKQLEEFIRTTR